MTEPARRVTKRLPLAAITLDPELQPRALRRGDGARITISSNRRGLWAFAVAQEFVDLGAVMDGMPALDSTVEWERPAAPERRH